MFVFVSDTKCLNNIIVVNNKTGAIVNRVMSKGSNTRLQKLCGTVEGATD